jgi:Uncharacterised protein family (UPF0236)
MSGSSREIAEVGVGNLFKLIGDSLNGVEGKLKKLNFYDLEQHSDEVTRQFGQYYLQMVTNLALQKRSDAKKICCTSCKEKMELHKSEAARFIDTQFGEVGIKSDYYYCRDCKTSVRPADKSLDLGETSESPALQEKITLFAKDYPFERAAEMLKRTLHIEVSPSRIRNVAEHKGQQILDGIEAAVSGWQQAQSAAVDLNAGELKVEDKTIDTIYLEMDGSMVPLQKEWKEAKLVVSFEQKDRATTGNKDRPVLLNKNYTGKIASIGEFEKYFEYHVKTYGVERAKNLVLLADGAEWIWNLAERQLSPGRIEILDYYHASEYAWDFAKKAFDEEAQIKLVAEKIEGKLLESSPLEAIDYIKTFEMQMTDELKKAAYNTIVNYYEKHRNRMDYKSYREQGFIIGSGAIEGGNKKVIQARCKGSGMHWTVAGANSIIALRCQYECNKWDEIKWGGYGKAA